MKYKYISFVYIKQKKAGPMKSTKIADTTKKERIELIKSWQEPEDGLEDSGMDLFDMYHDYIEGIREIKEINASMTINYITEEDLR